jgi:hypothetical protein
MSLTTASPVGGIYSSAQSITLTVDTLGCQIYYTLDGSDPALLVGDDGTAVLGDDGMALIMDGA